MEETLQCPSSRTSIAHNGRDRRVRSLAYRISFLRLKIASTRRPISVLAHISRLFAALFAAGAILDFTIINYVVLFFWFGVFVVAHDWLLNLHGRLFRLSEERLNSIHYLGMAIYKIGILLFNLIPYIALSIVSHHFG